MQPQQQQQSKHAPKPSQAPPPPAYERKWGFLSHRPVTHEKRAAMAKELAASLTAFQQLDAASALSQTSATSASGKSSATKATAAKQD